MDLRDCQSLALAVAARFNDDLDAFRGLARVLEEAGEVAAEVARLEGTGSKGVRGERGDLQRLEAELADVLINIAGLANTYGLNLAEAMEKKKQGFIEEFGDEAYQVAEYHAVPEGSPVVTVHCSSSPHVPEPYLKAAAHVGESLASAGLRVMYGGGSLGSMGAMSHAFSSAGGELHAVILARFLGNSGTNEHINTLSVATTMRSRKRGLAEPADIFLALPGGYGTLEELTEVVSLRVIGLIRQPIVVLNLNGFYDSQLEQFERIRAERFAHHQDIHDFLTVVTEAEAVAPAICTALNWSNDQ